MTQPPTEMVSVSRLEPGIALVTIDMPGSSANVLTTEMFAQLERTFRELAGQPDWNGAILFSAKPRIFMAGADLKAINRTLDWPDERIIEFCEDGIRIMRQLSTMPFPTCAAIHGACVGGGLELALWCDRRVASNRQTRLGLPEVKLGLIPGWAGTVRLPRLCGLSAGLDLITSARLVDGKQAESIGMVDAVAPPEELLAAATAQIEQAKRSEAYLHRRAQLQGPVRETGDLEASRHSYLARIADQTEIDQFAPSIVLEHMLKTANLSHDQACQSESRSMAEVYGSPASHGLLNDYFLGEHNRKHPGFVSLSVTPQPIQTVGIVGAGIMGCGIAQACAESGLDVILMDIRDEALKQAEAYLQSDRVTTCGDYAPLAPCDLVIEAVVESLPIKQQVFRELQNVVQEQATIATNTSAIPLRSMVDTIEDPGRFCGIHFCHPQIMSLIEIVRGERTSEQTMATAVTFIRAIGKMPVAVKDSPGFVVNRLLTVLLDQTLRLAEQGHTIDEIDQAMRDFGFRAGPFEIMDIIGTDTCMLAGRAMWNSGIRSLTPSPVLPKMVKQGWLGRKSLNGFYRYERIDGPRQPNPLAADLLVDYQAGSQRLDLAEIGPSIMAAVVLEATRLLAEKIVADPRDIDLCIINGLSFPRQLGGVLFWAGQLGIDQINAYLDRLAVTLPQWAPTELLRQMAKDGQRFY